MHYLPPQTHPVFLGPSSSSQCTYSQVVPRNNPLIPVSVLPFFSHSPWIMPTHLLIDAWFPTRNKFLTAKLHSCFVLHSSTGFPGKKKPIPIHSASSASLRYCENLHLISQLYQLKKQDYILPPA